MLQTLRNIGVKSTDSASRRHRKLSLLLIICSCLLAAPVLSAICYAQGLSKTVPIPFIYIGVMGIAVFIFSRRRDLDFLLNAQLFAIYGAALAMQLLAGGFLKGGILIGVAFIAPATAFVLQDAKKAWFWTVVIAVTIVAIALGNSTIEQWGFYAERNQKLIQLSVGLVVVLLILLGSGLYFVRTIGQRDYLLAKEQALSQELLLNILPAKVAEERQLFGRISPRLYTDATIMFTDFKDFTQFSELFTPAELIKELEYCFNAFDEIIARYGLEKIKTIGDAYMCVAGVPPKGSDAMHDAVMAVMAGLDIAQFIRETKEQRLKEGRVYWDIRIGIHTGDVVAGIVGKKKFAFDIWGDAVNTANRLEAHSEEGKVNISGTTYEQVSDYFNCIMRGRLAVKNKGELDMYFVESIKPEKISDLSAKQMNGSASATVSLS